MTVKRKTVNAGGIRVDYRADVPDTVDLIRILSPVVESDLKDRAEKVAAQARVLAPKKTGRLTGSIKVRQARDVTGQFATGYEVAVDVPYALYVHEGTRPHVITGRPLLAFFWAKTGRMMYLKKVNHPGTRANPFLTEALRKAE